MGKKYLLFLLVLFVSCITYGQKITADGPLSFCVGGKVMLSVIGADSGVNFQWKKDNVNIATAVTASYIATTSGDYTVYISKRTGGKADTTVGPVIITVYNYPTANFNSNVQSDQCRNTPIQFTNTSTGDISYVWDFGDPNSGNKNTSTQKDPSHVFVGVKGVKTQSFTVKLTVTGAGGCSTTITKTITINQKTDAALNGSGLKTYNGESYFTICANGASGEFTFTNNSSTSTTNTQYQIIWGDGSADYKSATFTSALTHTYTIGAKNLLFIVTGSNGCIDSTKYKVFLGTNPAVGMGNPGNTSVCTESTLTFPISQTQDNSPETNYTVIVNDGSQPVTFSHPPPLAFTHKFLISSCGTVSGNYFNSFSAKIIASNPCFTSEAIVTPIYVSGKPKASFKIPSNIVCVNKLVAINNTSPLFQNVTNGICSAPKVVWKISPSTGWTLQSGSLGNDNGQTNTDLWTGGSGNLGIIFTTTGKYTITLSTGNVNCGVVTTSSEICVNPTPSPSFIIDKNIGCANLDVAATSSINALICGTYKYKWTVDYASTSGCTPSIPDYKYTSGSDESENPKFQFLNPGIYTIGLVVSIDGSDCISQKITKTVTVKGKPVITIETLPAAICQFGSITPKSTVKCFTDASTKYTWTFDGGLPATSTNADPGKVVYNIPGTYSIKLTVENECGISSTTSSIKVDPTPIVTLPGNMIVCAGDEVGPLNFVSSPASAISWSSSKDIGFGINGVTNPLTFTAKNQTQNPITATITVTGKINNCSAVESFTITVNSTPPSPTVNSQVNYCQNAIAIPLTASATTGNSLLWYSEAVGGIGSTISPTPSTASVGSKTYYVSQKNTITDCESPRVPITVSVYVIPSIGSVIPTNPTQCNSADGSIILTGLSANIDYLVSYNGKPVISIKSNASGEIKITGLSAGAYNNIYVLSKDCPSNKVSTSLSDPSSPAIPTAESNSPICEGSTLNLKSSSTTAGSIIYTWTGPNRFSITQQNPTIVNTTIAAKGTYQVTATQAGCTSAAGKVEVIINPTPQVIISSNAPICSGSDLELKSTTSFVDALTYAWTGPNGFTSGLKNPIISNATVSNGGSYHLKITSSELCFSEQTISVAVNQTFTITASPNDPLNCAQSDGSIIIHGLIKNSFYTIGYTKNAEAPIVRNNISSDVNGNAIISGLGQGDYTKIYVILNNCPSNEVSVSLKDPSSPIIKSIANNGPLCAGSTLNLITITDPGVSYSWTGPNGFLSTTQNPLKPNVTSADGGKYTLIIEKNKCSSSASTDVIVNALPATPVVNNVEYCIGSPATPLSATPSAGNTLIWYTTSTGGIGSLIAPTPQTTTAGTTSYFVSQTDGNSCESKRAEIKVIIHPDAVAEFAPTNIIDCPPFTINTQDIGLKEFPLNNKLYKWFADGIYIGEGITFPGYTITNEDETVTIQLKTSSLFSCKDAEVSHTFSTYKLPHPVFTLSTVEGCGPLTVSISNTTPNPTFFNYFWDFGNGTSSSNANPGDVIFASSPDAGDTVYVVKLKVWNNCDTIVVEKSVRVKSKPLALFTPSKTEGCSPMTVTFTNTTKGENVTYIWDFGDGQTESTNSAGEVTHTFNTGMPTTFTVRLTATNNCGTDFKEFKIVVSPNPIKLKFAMNGPDHFGCEPHTVVIDNNSSGASSFFWDFGDGNFLSTTKGVDQIQHTYLTPGDYTITVKASNNCTDTIAYDYVHVYPKPKAAFTADRYVVCIGNELFFKNESQLATSYLWEFGDGITSTLSDPKHIYKNAGLYTVKLTVFKLNGPGSTCTEIVEQKIQVNTIMPGSITMSATEADCAPFTISFENDIKPSVTAVWDFGDGNTGVGDAIQHTYQSSGIYQVTLTITVPGGCTYVTQKTVTIKGPSGTFTYNSGFTCSTDAVRFEAHATGTDTYFWDFGDGNNQTTTTPIVYHTYANGGTYLPTVTFKNNTGCNYYVKGLDSIKVDKIEAGFMTTQEKTCGITKVNFSDTSHVLFGKKEILWNFGDGAEGVGANVSHTYTASGIYTMTMTIKGNSNCQEIITKNIEVHVNNNPIVVITAKTEGCNNKSVSFSANINSVDEINTIKWGISNGITGSGKSFDYLFLIPGTYTVTWTVGTVNGCFGTATHTITINPSPVVKASADVIICLGNSTQLNVSGAPNYQWSPLEGLSCTNCANPIAKPLVSTPYLVEGTNSFGCVDADTLIVTVIQPLQMTNSGNDSICIGQSANLLVSGAASYLWTPSQGLSSTTISNPIANPIITTIYRVVGYDGYNCFTDTAFIVVGVGDYPTVNLGPDQTLSTGTIFPLKTTITNGPIKNWLWTPTTNLDCINCALPNAHIKKDITYTVKVTTSYGCEASDTINIKVFCENTQVFIPNAFTPDGDGVNDILMVRGTGIVTVKSFRIFNRWGELVFEKNNFPPNEPSYGWDGRVKGKMSSSEVYVYTAEVLCENGVSFIYKGNTTILK